jgi:hypothetical protein
MTLNALIPTMVQPFNLGNSPAHGVKVGNALLKASIHERA